jgi:hypothetical protein
MKRLLKRTSYCVGEIKWKKSPENDEFSFYKKAHFQYMLPSDIFVLIKHVEEKTRMDKNKKVINITYWLI